MRSSSSFRQLGLSFCLSATMLVAGSFVNGVSCYAEGEVDESKEPPLVHVVKIDDQEVTVGQGESVPVEGTFTNPKVSVHAAESRVFPYRGMSFRYPQNYAFEADVADPNVGIWTLTGTDTTIMIFAFSEKVTSESYARDMLGEFGEANAKITEEKTNVQFGDQKLTGATLQAVIAGQKLEMSIHDVPTAGKGTTLLVIQDLLNDQGNRSAEGTATIKMMQESFEVKK